MDRWCRDFDNWGICDTLCFNLFDRTPHAWAKVASGARPRRVREAHGLRAAVGLACTTRAPARSAFLEGLRLIERAAADERHFVKKAVNMALRAVGRRTPRLHAAALAVARRLAVAEAAPRWVGETR